MAIAAKISASLEKSSWIRKMFEQGNELRKIHGNDNVFDFTIGNPAIEPPDAFNRHLLELAQHPIPGMHRYMSNAGYEETRKAIADRISETSPQPLEARHIVMTCGAGGALNVTLKTILDPGDEVIVLSPFFVEYRFYIDNHGGVTKEVPTVPETFLPDISAIERAIGGKTRAILINSPNNPTGVVYPAELLDELGALLERKGREYRRTMYLISDEPYARILYDGAQIPCVFAHIRNAVIATSHSKDLALPGERIGYLAANPAMDDVDQFMAGAIFSNRILGYVNAPALMQRLVARLQHESVDIAAYQEKRDLLYNHITALGFATVKPQGAFYLFPRTPIEDDVAFVQRALKYNILTVPGSGFGMAGHVRLAYCVDKAMIERSLPAWEKLAAEFAHA
jgi:aspartate aminotransferase